MPDPEDTVVIQALASVIRDHGWRVAADPARLRASVSDVLGSDADEHRGLVDALVVSSEEGTPRQIRDAGLDGVAARRAALVSDLESWGLSGDRAGWVVDAWTGLLPGRTDTPPTTSAPPVVAEDATTLPGGPLVARVDEPPTELPPTEAAAPVAPTRTPARRWRRTGLIAAVVVVLVAAGTGIALSWGHRDHQGAQPPSPHVPPSASAGGHALAAGHVALASKARPPRSSDRFVMADHAGGVQLRAFGPVGSVGAGKSMVMPPQGGSLVAFTLADWCPTARCAHWQRLGLRVAVGGAMAKIPAGGKTYVVGVPQGERRVALVLKADGHDQRLSLTDGRASGDNITALTRKLGLRHVTGGADTVATTSLSFIQYGSRRAAVTRHAVVTAAGLTYFAGRLTPKSAGHALLYVHAYYDFRAYGDTRHFPFSRDEVHFQPAGGRAVAPLVAPTAGGDGTVVYVFEVPASLRTGAFLVGGQGLPRVVTPASASAAVPAGTHYSLSLSPARIPVRIA